MVDGNLSNPFQVTTWVLQGDVLVSFLFIVLIYYLMKRATENIESGEVTHPHQSRRHPAKIVNDLYFSDDIALLESSIRTKCADATYEDSCFSQTKRLCNRCPKNWVYAHQLQLNHLPPIEVYEQPINHVSNFRSLGRLQHHWHNQAKSTYMDHLLETGKDLEEHLYIYTVCDGALTWMWILDTISEHGKQD